MDTLLITGISGFLGWNLARHLNSQFRVYGTYLDNQISLEGVETLAFDLTDFAKIPKLCETVQPRVIVHTAAYADPDYCEAHHKEALTLNTFATRELAKAAGRLSCKLIYISTDFVFDGERGDYSEADEPAPINYYGKTKFLGELEITNNCSDYVNLRISTLYGRGNGLHRNFFEKMEQTASEGKKQPCIVDQYRTLLFVEDAVQVISSFVADKRIKGLFHLGGAEKLSRFQFAQKFCRVSGVSPALLEQIQLADSGLLAKRPKDCSLKSNKLLNLLNITPTSVETALRQLLQPRQKANPQDPSEVR